MRKIFFLFLTMFFFSLLPLCVKTEELYRSSSLHEIITEEGDVERKDFVDDQGTITYASNMHYATVIKTHKDHSVIEEYFDEKGNPAKQKLGYYGLIRDYNELGQDYKITYLDDHDRPTITGYGYTIVFRKFDENGRISKEAYFDENEKPVKTRYLGCASVREYDKNGRTISISFLDEEGNLMVTNWGYAVVEFAYYESTPYFERVKYEFYFDDQHLPINIANGHYGLYHEYDEYGRSVLLTYLDADGNPVVTREGYTTIKRTYYADDSVQTEFYYDPNGNPVRLSEGQYGLFYEGTKKTYLDAEGNEIFNLKNYLYGNQIEVVLFSLLAVIIALFISKKMNYVFVALYCAFILYMTVMHRESGISRYSFVPFGSYIQAFTNPETIWGIINNILLFIPLGSALYRICPGIKILLFPLALSFAIEIFQLLTSTGYCEIDDIINNGLGGLMGFYNAKLITKVLKRINIQGASSSV